MPILGGIEATYAIKNYELNPIVKRVKVVAVTAFPTENIKKK